MFRNTNITAKNHPQLQTDSKNKFSSWEGPFTGFKISLVTSGPEVWSRKHKRVRPWTNLVIGQRGVREWSWWIIMNDQEMTLSDKLTGRNLATLMRNYFRNWHFNNHFWAVLILAVKNFRLAAQNFRSGSVNFGKTYRYNLFVHPIG